MTLNELFPDHAFHHQRAHIAHEYVAQIRFESLPQFRTRCRFFQKEPSPALPLILEIQSELNGRVGYGLGYRLRAVAGVLAGPAF